MTSSLEWLSAVIVNYPFFKYLIVFLGAAFGGEVAVISLSFLAAHGVFSLLPFLSISFLGTTFGDIVWFSLGKSRLASKVIGHRYAVGTLSVIIEAIRRVSRGNRLLAFIFAKFLVGTRAIVIIYVSKTNISSKNFSVISSCFKLISIFFLLPTKLV